MQVLLALPNTARVLIHERALQCGGFFVVHAERVPKLMVDEIDAVPLQQVGVRQVGVFLCGGGHVGFRAPIPIAVVEHNHRLFKTHKGKGHVLNTFFGGEHMADLITAELPGDQDGCGTRFRCFSEIIPVFVTYNVETGHLSKPFFVVEDAR